MRALILDGPPEYAGRETEVEFPAPTRISREVRSNVREYVGDGQCFFPEVDTEYMLVAEEDGIAQYRWIYDYRLGLK